MARKVNARKETKWEPLFEVSTENLKAQGTFKSEKTDEAFYGYINLIFGDMVAVKCSLIEGSNGPFVSFPQTKKGKEYYSQVVPMSKEVAQEVQDIAKLCADAFDDLA